LEAYRGTPSISFSYAKYDENYDAGTLALAAVKRSSSYGGGEGSNGLRKTTRLTACR
jgi:hypothetical protein